LTLARRLAPLVAALAERLRPHAVTAVCGPLLGGAFLAQSLAANLGVDFYYAEPRPPADGGDGSVDNGNAEASGTFRARYDLPTELSRRAHAARVAVVDDVISAGSSVRAAVAALEAAGASIAVVAALLVLGDEAVSHFAGRQVPIEALGREPLALWKPDACPLCMAGRPVEDPR